MSVPSTGRTASDVLSALAALRTGDLPTHGGTTTAYVYDSGLADLDDLTAAAHRLMQAVNALDPTAFPSVARIENDLVRVAADLLGGDEATVGTVTSGGTESCLLAVLGARELYRERQRSTSAPGSSAGIDPPTIVMPVTGHPAFRKAAHLFGLTVRDVEVDAETLRPTVAAMDRAIGEDTALVVVSAPSYPHGVLDPVADVASVAAARGVPCHVDACIGGWVLPFLRGNEDVPAYDLSVPGVTSLSVDLHKYGYAPKGVSLLLHRDADLRRRHWFAWSSWPGYPVVNPALSSSRSAGPAAAAWALLQHLGIAGYEQLALTARSATRRIVDGVSRINGLRVLGDPATTLVAVAGAGEPGAPDVRVVADEMAARGWFLQPQPGFRELPPTVHITVTPALTGQVDELLAALTESVLTARSIGPAQPDPTLVAMAQQVDPVALTPQVTASLLKVAGLGDDGSLPARMAPIYALLDAIPAPLAERLLVELLGRVLSPGV